MENFIFCAVIILSILILTIIFSSDDYRLKIDSLKFKNEYIMREAPFSVFPSQSFDFLEERGLIR